MSFEVNKVDPCGDVLMTLQPGTAVTLSENKFLVSKKHLTLASRRAQRMFAGSFRESIPDDDGLHHWRFEPVFDRYAFEIVLNIIHGKTRAIPHVLATELLAKIAVVVDDLECHDAVWYFAKGWLNQLRMKVPNMMCPDIIRWIFIAFVFNEPAIFESSTSIAIKGIAHYMPTHGLPLRPKILEQVEKRRQDILEKLVDDLSSLESRLLKGELGCSLGCRSMLLGTLIQGMNASDLYSPRPSKPFYNLILVSTCKKLRDVKSPKYYCTEEDSTLGNHSGVWTISSPPVDRTSKGGRTPSYSWGGPVTTRGPQRLVWHQCSVEDHISDLLLLAETGVHGLKLSDYN